MIKQHKINITKIALIVAIFCIFLFQKSNYISIENTINLFLESIMPSLFSFILITNIIISSNTATFFNTKFKKYGNLLYASIIGFFCGYPMGAKAAYSLYNNGLISKNQLMYLMSFANNCNPIFILSTIGISVLNNLNIGLILLFSHYMSALIICIFNFKHKDIIHENYKNANILHINNNEKLHKSTFEMLDSSIKSTFITLGNILAYTIIFNLLFSIIESILLRVNVQRNIIYILSGIFEVTRGIKTIFLNCSFNSNIVYTIISFILSFSGLSILFQIYSCIYKAHVKITYIIKYKLLQGLISGTITYIVLNIATISNKINISFNAFNYLSNFLVIASLLFIFAITIKKVTQKG